MPAVMSSALPRGRPALTDEQKLHATVDLAGRHQQLDESEREAKANREVDPKDRLDYSEFSELLTAHPRL